jgi:hypothetical protein
VLLAIGEQHLFLLLCALLSLFVGFFTREGKKEGEAEGDVF